MNELLRRAWDTLDSFKQVYPENWQEDDQQVLDDLIKADADLSGIKRKWVGLTAEEREQVQIESYGKVPHHVALIAAVEKLLKEKNCGR